MAVAARVANGKSSDVAVQSGDGGPFLIVQYSLVYGSGKQGEGRTYMNSPSSVGRHIILQTSPRLVEDHGVVLVLTRDTLLGGDQACCLHYPQSIAARLMSPRCHCGAPNCKRCDRRVRASFRADSPGWSAHREAKQYQKHYSLESRLLQ